MMSEERSVLEVLNAILRSKEVRAQMRPIVERVRGDLAARQSAVMAWEPIPLSMFGEALPPGIKSSWVFILRAGVNTGAERHPNSHQRMMSWDGKGDMQVGQQSRIADRGFRKAQSKQKRSEVSGQRSDVAIKWQSNVLVSDPGAALERRWISIPQNVWHQPVVANEADWVVVSFHTVSADELIEERPDDAAANGTKQKTYLGEK